MKRILFTITLLSVSFLATFAQKETFFADKTSMPVSISNLQGITAEVEMQMYGKNYSPRTLFPVKISYFNEIKLGKSTSLMLSGGLSALNTVLKSYREFNADGTVDPYSIRTTSGIGLQLSIAVAPRWYFALNKATSSGKDAKLVSGFYFGLPLELMSSVLNSEAKATLFLHTKPTVGYRCAMNKHLFAEVSAGVSINRTYFKQYVKPFFADFKIGYAFK